MNIKFNWKKMLSILFATLLLVSCGGGGNESASAPPPTVTVDTGLNQGVVKSLPGHDGSVAPRPIATITDELGNESDFVENELWISTDDTVALDAFVLRWKGRIVQSFIPADYDLTGMTPQFLVEVDVSAADTTRLQADLLALDPNSRGAHRVSSDNGLKLITAGAKEASSGLVVGMNWVGRGSTFRDKVSLENLPSPPPGSGTPVDSNAFNWTTHNTGSNQNTGVAEAWRAMELAGKLGNKKKIAILDMGFSSGFIGVGSDIPPGIAMTNIPFTGPLDTENLLDCGGSDCPWHGTNVASAAFAMPDNRIGAAGPAGPIASPVFVFTSYDYFTSIAALGRAFVSGARIANMSYGARVPATLSWSVIPFDLYTWGFNANGMLLFAAAGNAGQSVDAEDCIFWGICWEEAWHTPCENAGVTCVGGLADDSKARARRSNFGGEDVAIYAPFKLWVGPDPRNATSRQVNGTSFSSPFVAGVAGLIWAADPAQSSDTVLNRLMTTAHINPHPSVNRSVNALDAVKLALGDIPPYVRIVRPYNMQNITRGTTTYFDVEVDDFEDGVISGSVTWESSIDGILCNCASYSTRTLSIGDHVITVSVTDSGDNTSTDSVLVYVQGSVPTVTIATVTPLEPIYQSQTIFLTGTSFDPLTSSSLLDSQVSWTVDGLTTPFIGGNTGHSVQINGGTLGVGSHLITLQGNNGDIIATASRTIIVDADPAANLPPTAIIDIPANGALFEANQFNLFGGWWYADITFCGHGDDPEDGLIQGRNVEWHAREVGGDGVFYLLGAGSGPGSCAVGGLSVTPGGGGSTTYEVRMSVTDSNDALGTTVIQVTVWILI